MACSAGCAHVVLVPTPVGGHCIPFFYLASRFAHLGLRVTFLVAEGLVPQLYTHKLFTPHVGLIQREGIEVLSVKDGFSHLGFGPGLMAVFREASEPQLVAGFSEGIATLMSSTKVPAPCCIVSDMLMGWTQIMAAKFNIPRFVLHTQSAANLSLMLHVPTLLSEGRLPLTETNQEKPVEIPGFQVPLPTSELPSDLHPNAMLPNAYETFLRISRRAAEAPIVLVNTFRELEDNVFDALDGLHQNSATPKPKVIPVGPLLPSAAFSTHGDATTVNGTSEELDESIMRFLDSQPRKSVLFITFGTAGILQGEQHIQEIALGLEASGQPFLWTQGPSLMDPNKPTLSQLVPPGFLERTKERGMVVSAWAPQMRILQHLAVGAFLSHCGWNSVLESIAAGLPILAWPQRAEQKMNARFLVDVAKVAVEFQRSEGQKITRREIERVVRLVMQQQEGEALRSNIQSLKEAAARNASSVEGLKAFVSLCEDMCKHRCCT
ncbi:hypothetical protein M758_11G080500 [Ceratodon purpureus]|nr:hypothetical protein M758_11G080500 [Ceratodon purpureus]KAG0601057.1 hypothetical protein M758_11G080500 [Ceratodon purpureus]